jgi:hypothetical protein
MHMLPSAAPISKHMVGLHLLSIVLQTDDAPQRAPTCTFTDKVSGYTHFDFNFRFPRTSS